MRKKLLVLVVFALIMGGCTLDNSWELTKSNDDISSKTFAEIVQEDIGVQALESGIDRQGEDWLERYCIGRIEELGELPGTYEKKRGPFISFEPVYLPVRHSRFVSKATCNMDYYIWPVREQAFANMSVDYAYSQAVWDTYHEAVGNVVASRLRDAGWKELMNKGDVGVKPYMSYSFDNSAEKLTEYLDVFFTKDEEVVFELLVIDRTMR